jgi:hypothetical protein
MNPSRLHQLLQKPDTDADDVLSSIRELCDFGVNEEEPVLADSSTTVQSIAAGLAHILLLSFDRPSPTGGEVDTIGLFVEKLSDRKFLYCTSDASGLWDYESLLPEADLEMAVADLLANQCGWRVPQLDGTTLTNNRPDLLSKNSVDTIIREIVTASGSDDGFDTKHYMSRSYFSDQN